METEQRVYASVVLKAPSGRSVLDVAATADQIDGLRPDSAAVAKAVTYFEQVGFRIEQPGITLSISGPKTQFESVFGMHLTAYEQDGQTYYRIDKPATIPAPVQSVVQGIVLAEPTQYFN
ncbi:protease pro-enzyme activation domain-containing protein [Spirosoma utsteinense]|uniref:Subtilase family serine protease n=1 Tax=Spirosoma utsteinense TaxID=2585773 RepID=A0ABR6W404_9BACT|nr:protease pro-enzyme activation domain-containing protein [Spirosoma utsteinense]MBC3787135.1 subtilase family serine protease [Spirosoma utsteinense]MBC3791315.1 subtilase family serine protease [Spirosoma utsteinense]